MKKKFNFPVLVLSWAQVDLNGAVEIIPKREPIFCFKDDRDCVHSSRYVEWKKRCNAEIIRNQRPVSAKERAESTFAKPMEDKQP